MPLVLELPQLDLTRTRRLGRRHALERLHAGFFVGADDVRAGGLKLWCLQVRSTDGPHLFPELLGVGRLGIEPVSRHVRL